MPKYRILRTLTIPEGQFKEGHVFDLSPLGEARLKIWEADKCIERIDDPKVEVEKPSRPLPEPDEPSAPAESEPSDAPAPAFQAAPTSGGFAKGKRSK